MEVFGWFCLVLLMVFAIAIISFCVVFYLYPLMVTECKTFKEKMRVCVEDRKYDIGEKSKARRNRDEIKRKKQEELEEQKLENKQNKIDAQIKLLREKAELCEKAKKSGKKEKSAKEVTAPVAETPAPVYNEVLRTNTAERREVRPVNNTNIRPVPVMVIEQPEMDIIEEETVDEVVC